MSGSKFSLGSILRNGLLLAWALVCLLPILWEVTIALRPRTQTFVFPPIYVPDFTLEAIRDTFVNWPAWLYLRNTAVAAGGSVVLDLILGIPAAYALARYKFPGREQIGFYILSTRMIVPVAVSLPIFIFVRSINLLDNVVGLMLVYTAFNLALVVWIIRSYFIQIPDSVEEAARLDGLGELGVMFRIAIPMSFPGIFTASIIALIFAVNEYLLTLLISSTEASQTLSVGLAMFTGGQKGIIYNNIAVLAIFTFIPMLILTMMIQKYLSRGLSFGLVKG